jgi:hypothetical protein
MRSMIEFIENLLNERRSIAKALADLIAKYEVEKSPHLVRMIQQLEAEIVYRSERASNS